MLAQKMTTVYVCLRKKCCVDLNKAAGYLKTKQMGPIFSMILSNLIVVIKMPNLVYSICDIAIISFDLCFHRNHVRNIGSAIKYS